MLMFYYLIYHYFKLHLNCTLGLYVNTVKYHWSTPLLAGLSANHRPAFIT